ncbi:hypothetical protein AVEN_153456-1 [Araneus ventricosus]|uniref:RNase H type-1 domain-containing protein n=1 Tax=Araneus ventricosus TaxID=182803 RepID=A0A4Y1ZUD0_ARAVE|nr:hypothetical protein AVEN_153456-1 [Araneus ventricosus]
MALDFCVSLRDGSLVHIYRDSTSALQSLADPRNTPEIANVIKRSVESLNRVNKIVLLHWIKAYVGYPGNELANHHTKRATKLDQVNVFTYKSTQ